MAEARAKEDSPIKPLAACLTLCTPCSLTLSATRNLNPHNFLQQTYVELSALDHPALVKIILCTFISFMSLFTRGRRESYPTIERRHTSSQRAKRLVA